MCNLYAPSGPEKIAMRFAVGAPVATYPTTAGPLQPAPIVLRDKVHVAQWGLIPTHSPTRVPQTARGQRLSTNNCRRERMAIAPTFRDAWRNGQRCIIPADSYDEPCWETGRNVWWRFRRADGEPWALAGLWAEWTDPKTGECIVSFTMITQNCDGHPLLGRMHKPDPKLAQDQQDKRCPVPLMPNDWDAWLNGPGDLADARIRVPGADIFTAGPVNQPAQGILI